MYTFPPCTYLLILFVVASSHSACRSISGLLKSPRNLPKDSKVKADQIRTLDKARIITLIGKLRKDEIDEIDGAIKLHLALR